MNEDIVELEVQNYVRLLTIVSGKFDVISTLARLFKADGGWADTMCW